MNSGCCSISRWHRSGGFAEADAVCNVSDGDLGEGALPETAKVLDLIARRRGIETCVPPVIRIARYNSSNSRLPRFVMRPRGSGFAQS